MAAQQYYTAQEAMKKLGIAKSTFYTYVNEGRIQKRLPPHKQRGAYFLASEIDNLAIGSEGIKQRTKERSKTIFRRALPQDAQEMYELAQTAMARSGGYGIEAEKRLNYLTFPTSEIGHVLVKDGHIIGFFTLLPVTHKTLIQLMRGEVRASQILPEDFARFEPGEKIDCFIWEVIADPDEKQTGAKVIRKMLSFLHTLGKRGVEIEGLYAKATSPEGIDLSRKMGMHEMHLSGLSRLDYVPFEVKIAEMSNTFTKNYVQALKNYKKRHSKK